MAQLGTFERESLPPDLQQRVRLEDRLDILSGTRFEERAAMYDALSRGDDSLAKQFAWQKVRHSYPNPAQSPEERKQLHDLAHRYLKELKVTFSQQMAASEKGMASAARRGALYKPEQAQLPKEQREAIEGNRYYKKSDDQIKNLAVEEGWIDQADILKFSKTPASKMYDSPELRPELRERLQHERDRWRYGIPREMGTASEAKGPDLPVVEKSFAEMIKDGFVSGILEPLDTGVRAEGAALSTWVSELREDPRLYDIREKYSEGPKYMGLPTEIATPVGLDLVMAASSQLMVGPLAGLAAVAKPNRFNTIELMQKAPEDLSRIMGAQFSAAVDAASTALSGAISPWSEGAIAPDLVQLYGDTKAAYRMEAFELAEKQFPGESLEERQKRADVIYDELIKHDVGSWEFENPLAGQLTHAILLDPVFGPAGIGPKVIKGLWNMGKWGSKAIGLDKAYDSTMAPLTDNMRYLFAQSPFEDWKTWQIGEEALKKMGEAGESVRRALFGAKDAGEGAKRQILQAGKKVDILLSRVKGDDRAIMFDALELFHKTDSGAAAHKFLKEAFPNDPGKVKEFMGIVKKVRVQTDEVFKVSAARGQLNDVITTSSGEKVARTANYVDGYVPHVYYEGIGDIEEAVRRAGFTDINEAAAAGRLRGYLNKLGQTDNPAEIAQLQRSIDGLRKTLGDKAENIMKMTKEERRALYVLGEEANRVDILGAGRAHRLGITTDAAKQRLGSILQPEKDAQKQFSAYFKQQAATAGRAEELRELRKITEESEVIRNLSNGSAIKVLPLAAKSGDDWATKASDIAMPISDELGIEYVALDKSMSETLLTSMAGHTAPGVGVPKVISNKVVLMPKAMAHRLQETLPVVAGSVEKSAEAMSDFHQYFLKPVNHVWRNTKTVTRSLAFHATNIAGGIGLGVLAHGLRAVNPIAFRDGSVKLGLGGGAFRLALSSAFAEVMPRQLEGVGSFFKNTKLAKYFSPENMDWRLPSGETVSLAWMQELMSKYGIMGQAGLRYGSDLNMGKPLPGLLWRLSPYYLAKFTQKAAEITRMQQVAAFGDDLQHAIAFMGNLKSTKIDDIMKAIDFTAEYAGNYSRLTKFEKTTMRDTFAFYSWMRFIYPHIVKQVGKNPKRLSNILKGARSVAAYHEAQGAPAIPASGMPDYAQMGLAFPLSPEHQPPGAYDEFPHEVAVGMMELPFSSFGGLAPGFHGESPLVTQMGPAGLVLAGMLNGFDVATGRPYSSKENFGLPSLDEIEGNFESTDDMIIALGRVRDSRFGGHAIDMVPFGEAFLNMADLYSRHGMHDHATEMWLRYRVGRDWLGIDNFLAKKAGLKPMSRGLNPPGFRTYLVNPTQVAARRKARALEVMPKPMVSE